MLESSDGIIVALGIDLDVTVPQVADSARNPPFFGFLDGIVAKTYALDPAADRVVVGLHHEIVTQGKREGKAEGREREERVGQN